MNVQAANRLSPETIGAGLAVVGADGRGFERSAVSVA